MSYLVHSAYHNILLMQLIYLIVNICNMLDRQGEHKA